MSIFKNDTSFSKPSRSFLSFLGLNPHFFSSCGQDLALPNLLSPPPLLTLCLALQILCPFYQPNLLPSSEHLHHAVPFEGKDQLSQRLRPCFFQDSAQTSVAQKSLTWLKNQSERPLLTTLSIHLDDFPSPLPEYQLQERWEFVLFAFISPMPRLGPGTQ